MMHLLQLAMRARLALSFTLLSAVLLFGLEHRVTAATYVRLIKTPAISYSGFTVPEVATLAREGIIVLDDYGPFAMGLATDGLDLGSVGSSMRISVVVEPDAYRVDAGTTTLDIRSPEKALTGVPQDLQVADYPGSTGLYIVKFRGPIRREWMAPLTKAGVRFIQYLHSNAYIVASPGGLSLLQSFATGPVIYTGVFQPYFKLAATLKGPSALSASGPSTIRVLLDREGDLADVSAQLKAVDSSVTVNVPAASGDATASVSATAQQWRRLAAHPAVLAIEPWLGAGPSDERVDQVIAVRRDGTGLPINPTLYKSWLGTLCGGQCGNLSSEIVDVMDSGIATYHQDLPAGRVVRPRVYFGIGYLDDDYYHGTVNAGLIGGDPSLVGGTGRTDTNGFYYDMGVAPTVSLHPSRIFNIAGQIPVPYVLDAATLDTIVGNAYNDGARFQNASWNEGVPDYTILSREYDRLVRDATLSGSPDHAMTVIFSAGNNFTHVPATDYVHAPATAKNVITVGSTGIQRGLSAGGDMGGSCNTTHTIKDIASFSLQGVLNDWNRFKPDIYAPGDTVSAARSANMTRSSQCAALPLHLPTPDGPNYPVNGTSHSAPIVTGTAVLAKRKITSDTGISTPSPALIKAAILSTTETNSSGGFNYYKGFYNNWEPTPYQGWGRVALTSLLEDPVSKAYLDEDHAQTPVRRFVQSGSYHNFTFTVADPSKAISAVLVTTDAPAQVNAQVARVNEVDMYVLQGGYVYCDGQYGSQYATRSTGCWLPDSYNNVKRARIAPNSFTGQFTIQVVGSSIGANALPGRDGGGPNQDWALYVYNAIAN